MLFGNQGRIKFFDSFDQPFLEFTLRPIQRINQLTAVRIGLCFVMIASDEKDHNFQPYPAEIATGVYKSAALSSSKTSSGKEYRAAPV
jgi:hypothetical protein